MPITVEILPEAQRMVDEADEHWVAEHGFLADNPLLAEILDVGQLAARQARAACSIRS